MHTVSFETRPYQPADYTQMTANLIDAGLFDADYESETAINRWTQEHPDNLFVTEKAGQVIGSIYLQDSDIIPIMYRLVVARDHRRIGVGASLVRTAEKAAVRHGHSFVEIYVDPEEMGANIFWNTQGYSSGHSYLNRSKRLVPES